MMALVNLSVVFAVLAVGGGAVMVLGDAVWPAAVVVLVGGLVLARLCYLAAVSQVTQLAGLMRVAFDLYRHAILAQLGLATPSDLPAERTLWIDLTYQMLDGSVAERPVGADHAARGRAAPAHPARRPCPVGRGSRDNASRSCRARPTVRVNTHPPWRGRRSPRASSPWRSRSPSSPP